MAVENVDFTIKPLETMIQPGRGETGIAGRNYALGWECRLG
jgi:hypothetical protein